MKVIACLYLVGMGVALFGAQSLDHFGFEKEPYAQIRLSGRDLASTQPVASSVQRWHWPLLWTLLPWGIVMALPSVKR